MKRLLGLAIAAALGGAAFCGCSSRVPDSGLEGPAVGGRFTCVSHGGRYAASGEACGIRGAYVQPKMWVIFDQKEPGGPRSAGGVDRQPGTGPSFKWECSKRNE